jgi:hypothetical protein
MQHMNNLMNSRIGSGLAVCVTLLFGVASIVASAQSAFRCDDNGKTAYSDKPCPAGKLVAPTQDTAEQQRASKDANDRLRKDHADMNKRLSDREKQEAKERADARKQAAKAPAQKDAKKSNGKSRAGKAPKSTQAKKAPATKRQKKKAAGGAVSR